MTHTYHILVVEDEPVTLELYTEMLEEQGYRVTSVRDGLEAIDMYGSLSGEIDMVITDIKMPYTNGFELEKRLHRNNPDLPMIAVSGWLNERDYQERAERQFQGVMKKPFDIDELHRLIRKVLPRYVRSDIRRLRQLMSSASKRHYEAGNNRCCGWFLPRYQPLGNRHAVSQEKVGATNTEYP